MKRIILLVVAVLMLAAPALARVDITATCDGNEVTVSYVDEGNPADNNNVRAFALSITVDNGATITNVYGYKTGESVVGNRGYGIFPGTIDINDTTGEVDAWNTPVAPDSDPGAGGTGIGTGEIIVELGSLYVGEGNAPAPSDTLFKFTVDKDCNVAIAVESAIRGGVVLEDPDAAADPNCTGCTVSVVICYPECLPDWDVWDAVNRPECWCYPRQCHGDTDDNAEGKTVKYYVHYDDLGVLMSAWDVNETVGLSGNMICADFAHDIEGKTEKFRVHYNDLAILMAFWDVNEVDPGIPPDCLDCP